MGPGRMAVILKAAAAAEPSVEWWVPVKGAKLGIKSVKCSRHGELWIGVLEGLPVGTQLAYRVRSRVGAGKTHLFKAGAARDEPFRFAAFGDTRSGHEVHQAVVNAVAREHIDFVVHTGDMVHKGGVDSEWLRFFQIEHELLTTRPIFAVVGNHDDSPRQLYRHFFARSLWEQDQRFYSMDWGNLRIIGVDSLEECREGCSQYIYLDRALEEGAAAGMLMVILVHYPPYSSGAHGSNLLIRESIGALASRYGVELVLSGHDHNYERTEVIDGVTYVVTASAGAPIRAVRAESFSKKLRTEPHFVLIDVDSTGLTLRAVNLSGDTFDYHLIKPVPPRGG